MLSLFKRGRLVLLLTISLILIKSVNAQFYGTNIFLYISQLFRDLLYGIAQILSPILTREIFIGPYGYVYGRLIIGIVLGIVIFVSAKELPLVKRAENPNKMAGWLAVMFTLIAIIGIPDNVIYVFFSTPIFVGGLFAAILLYLLKGENRIIWAFRGLIYLVLVYVMGQFGALLGYSEIAGIIAGIGGAIFLIASIYNFGRAIFHGAGEAAMRAAPYIGAGGRGLGRGISGGARGLGRGLLRGATGAGRGLQDLSNLWNYGRARLSDEEKARITSKRLRDSIEKQIQSDAVQRDRLNALKTIISDINKKAEKLTPDDLQRLKNNVYAILNQIRETEMQTDAVVRSAEAGTRLLSEVDNNLARNLRTQVQQLIDNQNVREDRRTRLIGLANNINGAIGNAHDLLGRLSTDVLDHHNKSAEFDNLITRVTNAIRNDRFIEVEGLLLRAAEIKNNMQEVLGRIERHTNDVLMMYNGITSSDTGFNAEFQRMTEQEVREAAAAVTVTTADGTERFDSLVIEYIRSRERKQAPQMSKDNYMFFIHYLKERGIGRNEAEIAQKLGIDKNTMSRRFNRLIRSEVLE